MLMLSWLACVVVPSQPSSDAVNPSGLSPHQVSSLHLAWSVALSVFYVHGIFITVLNSISLIRWLWGDCFFPHRTLCPSFIVAIYFTISTFFLFSLSLNRRFRLVSREPSRYVSLCWYHFIYVSWIA